MHVFSRPRLKTAATEHPDCARSLHAWFKIAEKARWMNLNEVRADYPHADLVGSCVVFNIGGNRLRLITRIFYADEERRGNVYIIAVLTHGEYDRGKWKKSCDCD
jgi:mRNA interferase HigB